MKLRKNLHTEIRRLRKKRYSFNRISKILDIGETTAYRHSKDIPINLRKKWKFDERFFDKIDTEQKAYILGFLYADGNVYENTLSLSLQKKDLEILKKIKKCFKFDGPLNFRSKGMIRLRIYSPRLCNELKKYGIEKNKTFRIKFPPPNLNKRLLKHFIRGYFDGDGGFCGNYRKNKSFCFHFCGNKGFILNLQKYLVNRLKINKTVPKYFDNAIQIQHWGIKNVNTFSNFIYKESKLFLKRKRDRLNNYKKFMSARL